MFFTAEYAEERRGNRKNRGKERYRKSGMQNVERRTQKKSPTLNYSLATAKLI
jgi:hypothetical protein